MKTGIPLILLLLCTIGSVCQSDQVLMTVNDKEVYTSEFSYIYEKNNKDETIYSKESLEEYLELYKNFKLKVEKARELGYHEKEGYIEELAGYRRQLAKSYVIDKDVVDRIVQELIERKKWDIKVSHILVRVNRRANQQARADALEKIKELQSLINNGVSFEEVAQKYSEDESSSSNGGDIGFLTAIMPDEYLQLEDAIYSLNPGTVSDIIHTPLGFHLVQPKERRSARGKIDVSHILIRHVNEQEDNEASKALIDEIFQKANGGESFSVLASTYSQDKQTASNGGKLGYFGIGQFEQSFEDAAFSLDHDGAISSPVKTSIGWHVIRRNKKRPVETFDQLKELVKAKLMKGGRFDRVKREVVEEFKVDGNFYENRNALQTFIAGIEMNVFDYNWEYSELPSVELFSLGNASYLLQDFAQFVKLNSRTRLAAKGRLSVEDLIKNLYEEFTDQKTLVYAENHLEDKYVDFKNLIREYEEGILLFEITKDMVWDRAAKDTAGLSLFYNQHKTDYVWNDRAELSTYTLRTVDSKLIAQIMTFARSNDPTAVMEEFNSENEVVIHKIETVEKGGDKLGNMNLNPGFLSSPEINRNLKLTVFKKVEAVLPSRPKSLKEARGYVISDYQDVLEKEWTRNLNEQYEVVINKEVLNKLIQKEGQ